jgi:hypothetical protein
MKLYVVAHKRARMPKDPLYVPIQVGSGPDLYPVRDNTGDQIAEKNPNFCELTAMYWIWKNVTEDVVGIAHYRRYMTRGPLSRRIIGREDVKDLLQTADLLVPRPLCMRNETVLEQFGQRHDPKDLLACGQVIRELFPEYAPDFDRMLGKHYFYQYNMIVADKRIYDEYMSWLFPILFALEERVSVDRYDAYNRRLFGFLSERLLDVWLSHGGGRTYREMSYINTETADWTYGARNIKNALKEKYVREKYRE